MQMAASFDQTSCDSAYCCLWREQMKVLSMEGESLPISLQAPQVNAGKRAAAWDLQWSNSSYLSKTPSQLQPNLNCLWFTSTCQISMIRKYSIKSLKATIDSRSRNFICCTRIHSFCWERTMECSNLLGRMKEKGLEQMQH